MEKWISNKHYRFYTMLKRVIYDLELENKAYWWLISDIEAFPGKAEYQDLIDQDDYVLMTTADLLKMLEEDDFQWVWAVFSVIPIDYTEEEILAYDLPKLRDIEEGEYDPYRDAPRLQHPLAEFELYAVDSSEMFLITEDADLLERFKRVCSAAGEGR